MNQNNKNRKATPFTLPENYFEEFHAKLMQQLPEKKHAPTIKQIAIQKIKQYSVAASIAFIMIVGSTLIHQYVADRNEAILSEKEDNELIETLFDNYQLDDYNIYCYLTSADQNY